MRKNKVSLKTPSAEQVGTLSLRFYCCSNAEAKDYFNYFFASVMEHFYYLVSKYFRSPNSSAMSEVNFDRVRRS